MLLLNNSGETRGDVLSTILGEPPYGWYAARFYGPKVRSCSHRVAGLLLLAANLVVAKQALGQTQPYLYSVTFRGTSYQTNNDGQIIARPMTETTILQDLAAPIGVTDTSGWALAYHFGGNVFGDTIEVVNAANGAPLDLVLGFYFGSDNTLGRMALTNDFGTMERRVDQLYTKFSQYAQGSAFVTKRFLADKAGNVRATVDAELQYLARTQGTNTVRFCIGTFTTTHPFKPRP